MNTLHLALRFRPSADRQAVPLMRAAIRVAATRSAALLAIVLGATLATVPAPARAEYAAVSGSTANRVDLSVDCPRTWSVEAEIVSHPSWMTNLVLESAAGDGEGASPAGPADGGTARGARATGPGARIRFDVDPAAVAGTGGTLIVSLTARDPHGIVIASAIRRLPLRLATSAPALQQSTRIEECCLPSAGIDGAENGRPDRPVLIGAVPNPWSAGTAIRFGLPSAGSVRLRILDVTGRLVREIAAPALPPGYHELRWDGRNGRGEGVAPGVYVYALSSGDWVRSGKTLLLH